MPSLGKYDPLANRLVEMQDVETTRRAAESIVEVMGYRIQFDRDSRDRMAMVIKASTDDDQINWKMADNSTVAFFKAELSELYEAAQIEAGRRMLEVHEKAQAFKKRLADGERVTRRDIHISNW